MDAKTKQEGTEDAIHEDAKALNPGDEERQDALDQLKELIRENPGLVEEL